MFTLDETLPNILAMKLAYQKTTILCGKFRPSDGVFSGDLN